MNRIILTFVLSCAALTACNTDDAAKNELKLAPAPLPNTKAGVKDPSIQPVNGSPVSGVRDPSIKPLPTPGNKLGGIPDDSVKPVPKP